jgi:hypothetical protein
MMFGVRQALADDLTAGWKPSNPIFYDQKDGLIVFQYNYDHNVSRRVVRDKIVEWMKNEGFIYGEDYTLNDTNLNRTISIASVAVWFKDPQSFVMMKLKYA